MNFWGLLWTHDVQLKVVSAILGRNINDHIHLIFPRDPLAARLISRPSKNGVSVGSTLDREEISDECNNLCYGQVH